MGVCVGQSGNVTGLCGALCEKSGIVTGLCGGLWWTEWHCNRFMWGFVVDRVAL